MLYIWSFNFPTSVYLLFCISWSISGFPFSKPSPMNLVILYIYIIYMIFLKISHVNWIIIFFLMCPVLVSMMFSKPIYVVEGKGGIIFISEALITFFYMWYIHEENIGVKLHCRSNFPTLLTRSTCLGVLEVLVYCRRKSLAVFVGWRLRQGCSTSWDSASPDSTTQTRGRLCPS